MAVGVVWKLGRWLVDGKFADDKKLGGTTLWPSPSIMRRFERKVSRQWSQQKAFKISRISLRIDSLLCRNSTFYYRREASILFITGQLKNTSSHLVFFSHLGFHSNFCVRTASLLSEADNKKNDVRRISLIELEETTWLPLNESINWFFFSSFVTGTVCVASSTMIRSSPTKASSTSSNASWRRWTWWRRRFWFHRG